KLNSRGWGGNAFVGYHVNKYFGTELGFDVLGQNKWKVTNTSDEGTVNSTLKETNRWNIHFVGNAYLPVASWFSPFAFFGAAYLNTNWKDGSATVEKYSGLGITYGAGLEFSYQQFGVRLRYAKYVPSAGVHVDDSDISDTLSL